MGSLTIQSFQAQCLRNAAFRNFKGFTRIVLLAAFVIIGISLGSSTKYW